MFVKSGTVKLALLLRKFQSHLEPSRLFSLKNVRKMESGDKSAERDMERRVFIKQSGNPLTRFTSVSIMESDAVADLIKRASLTVGLRMNPAYVDLFLIPEESQDAVESGEGGFEDTVLAMRPLSHMKALSTVGVFRE